MVKPRHELLKWGIKNTKMRIKKGEANGMGDFVMKEKAILKRQERNWELIKQNG